jgi:hypothetical protein
MRFDASFYFGPRFPYWECSRIFCAAKRFNRARIAFRPPGYANKRAKIEQCGVESCGIGLWEKTRCVLPKHSSAGFGIDRFAQIEKPRQNATRVRFDDRNRLIKGKTSHCVRGVFPDSGKLSHLLDFAREVSAMSIHNRFCGGVEISRASVIAEALPHSKNFVFGSACNGGEIGKPAEPLVIIRDDCGDLRLLEHELGHENCVRISGPAPRKIAPVPKIPTQQATTKFG